ncbi:hypothetical protein NCCP2716_27560 [Sporosarcina sp. NCCP-2716]|uniref:DUF6011 domain-containing protein n=1 Tax=Sporosarcina sp. NCCP-2716 TaxID=2943679 RepID=UPI00203B749C|nr:DUF6011 domain-containing protein [Sporosarcina sp. NCCP-2716]GKV70258.1 hypothetical protein NCCP2716_27560 [Sporosarcina sp. NCCP-2716]
MAACGRCGRPLKTPESVRDGYGPICKRKQEEAEAEFLRIQVTIDEELEYQKKVKR